MTPRQAQCLRFIAEFSTQHGYSPSYAEIAAATGFRSRSNVHYVIVALEKAGRVRRASTGRRRVEIVESERDRLRAATIALRQCATLAAKITEPTGHLIGMVAHEFLNGATTSIEQR